MPIKKAGFLFTLIVATGILWGFYSDVLLSPNQYMFNQKGDAIKNYYSVFYHVNHDTNAIQSTGENYPNGEMLVYMDGQFAISNAIRFLKGFFPSIAHYPVGIMNILMLLSIPFSAIFLYLILLHYKVEPQFATVGALGLMLMQPQLFRLSGHFALTYAFVIPMSWYFLEKFRATNSGLWLFLLLWSNLTFFFIHPYLGLIVTLFELLVITFSWFFLKNKGQKIINILFQLFWLIIPLISFKIIVTVLDIHLNRSNDPYGIFQYQASWKTVFMPILAPLNPLINTYLFTLQQTWEGWSYIGLANVIGVIVLFFFLVRKHSRQTLFQNSSFKTFLPVLTAGWVLFVFSTGIVFEIGDGFIVDNLPIIKQFRSLGRFAWVFYYVTGVSTIILIQHVKTKEKTKFILIGLLGLLMSIEGIPYHLNTQSIIAQDGNVFVEEYAPEQLNDIIDNIDPSQYQALLPLPFYMIGSENMMVEGSKNSAVLSQTISARTGLSIIGGMLSRTSITETKETIKLLAPRYYPKPILEKFIPNKPILISYTNETLSAEQQGVLSRSKLLYSNSYGGLYAIYPSQFYTCPEDSLKSIQKSFPNYIQKNNCWVSDSNAFYFLYNLDSLTAEHTMLGTGALQQPKKGYRDVLEFEEYTFSKGVKYELTLWFYNKDLGRIHEVIGMHYFTPEGVNAGWIKYVEAKKSETIFGDWSLIRMEFEVDKPQSIIRLLSAGEKENMDVFLDNILIRDLDIDVVQKTIFKGDSVVIINNEVLPFCQNP